MQNGYYLYLKQTSVQLFRNSQTFILN